jgi:hypothetical protein
MFCKHAQTKGTWTIPPFGGTHPNWPIRMRQISNKLLDRMRRSGNTDPNAHLPGNLGSLILDTGSIFGKIDEQFADYVIQVGNMFETKVNSAQKAPFSSCANLSPNPPAVKFPCGTFTAKLSAAQPAAVKPVHIESNGGRNLLSVPTLLSHIQLYSEGQVSFIASALQAAGFWYPGGLLRLYSLPCQPTHAAAQANRLWVACEDVSLIQIQINAASNATRMTLEDAKWDGDQVKADDLRIGWLGNAGSDFVMSVYPGTEAFTFRLRGAKLELLPAWSGETCREITRAGAQRLTVTDKGIVGIHSEIKGGIADAVLLPSIDRTEGKRIELEALNGNDPLLACGPNNGSGQIVCIAASGRLLHVGRDGKPSRTTGITMPKYGPNIRPEASICATASSIFIILNNQVGDRPSTTAFMLKPNQPPRQLRTWTSAADFIEASCTTSSAAITRATMEQSEILLYPDNQR